MERQTSPVPDLSEPPRSGINETDGKEVTGSLRSFLDFPFSSDEVYQVGTCQTDILPPVLKLPDKQGLADLAARDVLSGRSEVEKAEIILQMQLFYFNRVTGQALTAEDVRPRQGTADPHNVTEAMNLPRSSSNCQDRETRSLTFAELKTLIELGKTDDVPNNKVIPDVLNVNLFA